MLSNAPTNLLKDKYILIVDDNGLNRLSLLGMCSRLGVIPVMCSSTEEAMVICDKYPFYAALIDIVMVGKSGYWLADYLVNEKKVKYPLIALSSIKESLGDNKKNFLHFIVKPVKEATLYELLLNIKTDLFYNTPSVSGLSTSASSMTKTISKSILIVDDIYLNRQILQKYLINYGVQSDLITVCDSGKECIELLTRNKYDIVLLDIKMPEVSGIDIYNYVKKNGLKRDSVYIAITGYVKESDNYYTTVEKFDYLLYKPIKYQHIKEIMMKCLQ